MTYANTDAPFAGAGPLENAAEIVKAIREGDWLAGLGNVVPTHMGAMDVFENPTKALVTSVIGWLLEHLTFLDSFLDWTAGDSGAVQNAAKDFREAAKALDGIAADQITAFGTRVDTYRQGASPSAQAFESRVGPRGDELKTLSLQCLGLADTMNTAGMMVATLRGVMRDLLAEFTWWVFQKGQLAMALAPYTAGGSLATLTTETCLEGAKLAKDFALKIAKAEHKSSTLMGFLKRLTLLMHGSEMASTFALSVAKNFLPAATQAVDNGTTLSAADAAQQQVVDYEAAEERKQHADDPLMPPQPEPVTPLPETPKKQGPGLGVKWTASGTLDE